MQEDRTGPAAAVFDLDGVITLTARVHAAAWKRLFDAYLRERARRAGEPFRPFTDIDYRAYVDGRPRLDGVRTFLASRGIALPEGSPEDPPAAETVAGLGARKNAIFNERLDELGVDVDQDGVRLVRELRARGLRVGMATSSKNGARILERAGLSDLFEARVDGVVSERVGLEGKPAPDIFLECLRRLGEPDPSRSVIVEDAPAGVRAGRAGHFGLVLGVAREENEAELLEHGADRVVATFEGVDADRIIRWYVERTERLDRPAPGARPSPAEDARRDREVDEHARDVGDRGDERRARGRGVEP